MQQSTVKWFDAKKGYGFIDHPSGGDDVFVHYSQIISTKDFKTLRTGQEVKFDLNDGPKGVHALDVKPLDEEGEGTKKAASAEEKSSPAEASEPSPAAGSTSPAPEDSQSNEAAPAADDEAQDDEEDDLAWDEEEWTDEHGNPPDPMASPSF